MAVTTDPVLEALEKVAVKFGKPHPGGTGLGFDWEETEVMNDFLLAVVEDYKKQLLAKLKEYESRCLGYQTDFGAGERHTIGNAIHIVESYEYH